jgi:hypothetical protein
MHDMINRPTLLGRALANFSGAARILVVEARDLLRLDLASAFHRRPDARGISSDDQPPCRERRDAARFHR